MMSKRKPIRCELRQGEFAGPVGVPACALDRDPFGGHFLERKFGNSFSSPCTTMMPPLRFSASTPSRIGIVPRGGCIQ